MKIGLTLLCFVSLFLLTTFWAISFSTYMDMKTGPDPRNHGVRFWRFMLMLPRPWGPDDRAGFDVMFPWMVLLVVAFVTSLLMLLNT